MKPALCEAGFRLFGPVAFDGNDAGGGLREEPAGGQLVYLRQLPAGDEVVEEKPHRPGQG